MKPKYYIISLSKIYGGAEAYIYNLCELLDDYCDIVVISPFLEPLHTKILNKKICFIEIQGRGFISLRLNFLKTIVNIKFRRSVEKKYFILNGRSSTYFSFIFKLFFGIEAVSIAHTNISVSPSIRDFLYIFSLKFCKSIIAVSDSTKENISKKCKCININSIPNWINLRSDNRTMEKSDVIKAIIISRLVEEKGILDAVAAFSHFENLELHLYGDGPLKKHLDDFSSKPGNGWLKVHGFVENARHKLHDFQIMICPSHDESFSYSTAEGISEGLLCVVSAIPAHKELLGSDYPEELFFQKKSISDQVRAVSCALKYFSEDHLDDCFNAVNFARKRISSRNSAERAKNKYINIIEGLR